MAGSAYCVSDSQEARHHCRPPAALLSERWTHEQCSHRTVSVTAHALFLLLLDEFGEFYRKERPEEL